MMLTREMFKDITPEMIKQVEALAYKADGNCFRLHEVLDLEEFCYNSKLNKSRCPFDSQNNYTEISLCVSRRTVSSAYVRDLCYEFLKLANEDIKLKLKDLDWEDSST